MACDRAGTSRHESSCSKRKNKTAGGADDAAALKMLAKQAGEAAQLLKLLGNEKRLLILCFLAARGEMTVGELVDVAKLSQSALSQHLADCAPTGWWHSAGPSQTLHYPSPTSARCACCRCSRRSTAGP